MRSWAAESSIYLASRVDASLRLEASQDQIAVPRSIDSPRKQRLPPTVNPLYLFWRRLDYAERRFGAAALATTLLRRNDLATMTRPEESTDEPERHAWLDRGQRS